VDVALLKEIHHHKYPKEHQEEYMGVQNDMSHLDFLHTPMECRWKMWGAKRNTCGTNKYLIFVRPSHVFLHSLSSSETLKYTTPMWPLKN